MQDCSLQLFEPHVGTTFEVILDGQPALELKLSDVEDLTIEDRHRDPSLRAQPFSLIFEGQLSPYAKQALYTLRHEQLGELEIFLVPLGPDKKTKQFMQYQAIFN